MTTLSELFPQQEILKPGQTRDPNELKRTYMGSSASLTAMSTTSTYNNMTTGGFGFVNPGTYSTSATDGTFTTVCDVTGSGVLYGVISQSPTNTTDDITFRITIDGVATTVVFAETLPTAGANGCRGVLGDIVSFTGPLVGVVSTAPLAYYTNGAGVGNGEYRYFNTQGYMQSPDAIEWLNGTRVLFDTDMKVEVKVTDVMPGLGAHSLAQYILGVQS